MPVTDLEYSGRLRAAGLRPTRQRIALARLLFEPGHRHMTAESLHAEVRAADMGISLATVYNALNQFRDAGLLREVVVVAGKSYFDTNTGHHHHFYVEPDGELVYFPSEELTVASLPNPPRATKLSRIDTNARLHPRNSP